MSRIEIEGVHASYFRGDTEVAVLDDLTITIPRGQFLALLGPSGSGKTTMLHLLSSLKRPDRGTIRVDSIEVTTLGARAAAAWRAENVGYIFQMHNLVPVLTAYENIELPLLLLGLSSRDRAKRVNIALEAVSLTDRADHYPRQLSGGQ